MKTYVIRNARGEIAEIHRGEPDQLDRRIPRDDRVEVPPEDLAELERNPQAFEIRGARLRRRHVRRKR